VLRGGSSSDKREIGLAIEREKQRHTASSAVRG
jgi:hypothetical protein